MKNHLRPALTIFVLLTVLTGVVYAAVVTGLAQLVFPHKANGSIIEQGGKPIGSALIGQAFDDPRYFWSRPSATSPFPYNAGSSNGSNLGPTNPDQIKLVKERIEMLRPAHPDQRGAVPVDLVTASASGLDPDISPAAAEYQVTRVAKARGLAEERVRALIAEQTQGRMLGILGEPGVNVLVLYMGLDNLVVR